MRRNIVLNEKGLGYIQRLLDYYDRREPVEVHVAHVEKVLSNRGPGDVLEAELDFTDDAGRPVLAELTSDEVVVREDDHVSS